MNKQRAVCRGKYGFGGLLVFLFLGCAAVGPNYRPPSGPVPDTWHTALRDGLTADSVKNETMVSWWQTLNDSTLSELIRQALAANLDMRQARARLLASRARLGIARSDRFPMIDASGAATKSRSSENSGGGQEMDLYAAGFDAGWEIDIFGGVRRTLEAAGADLQATEADLQDVQVVLAAEVARNYIELRTYQTRLSVAEANSNAQQKTFDLIESRFQAGLSDELAVQQARYNLESTLSQIPTLRSGLEAAKNRLAFLVGKLPGQLHPMLLERRPIPVSPVSVAVGVPAEALRRRPDIRRAERRLAAQTARIGVATADLYPKFHLLGTIGLEALEDEDFFEHASRYWQIGPSFSWKVFRAGAIRRNIEVQSAVQEQLLAVYEATLLGALEEVENSLTAFAQEQMRREHLLKTVDAARQAANLAHDRYAAGLVDFSNVLDAQRSLLSHEDDLAQSEGKVTLNLIGLFKALGGGWELDNVSNSGVN